MGVSIMAIMGGAALGLGFGGQILSLMPPLANQIQYMQYNQLPNRLPEAGDLIALLRRKQLSPDGYRMLMRWQGYAPEIADGLYNASTNLPTLPELVAMRMRNIITPEQYNEFAGKLGYGKDDAENYYKANLQLYDANTLIAMRMRNLITEAKYADYMQKIGYSPEMANKLFEVSQYYPTPSDLVRFAVREVYTPETRQKFGMDEDLPQEYLQAAAKAGLPEDQARNYWAAHWELPSPQMGFEMFQRGIITRDELNLLLKSLDVMPFWRDKLIKLAYSPYTRVDARRMYAAGVLSFEELVKTYKDIGYDDEHARKMAEWTATTAVEEERTLTKTQILKLYRDGEFDKETAIKNLKLIGYNDEAAQYLLALQDHEAEIKQQKDYMALLKTLYANGAISYEELYDELSKLNLSSVALNKALLDAENARKGNIKLPEKSDLLSWVKKKLITGEEFINRMLAIGYSEDDAKMYLRSVS